MKKLIVTSIVLFIATLMVSTSSVVPCVSSKTIMKNIEILEKVSSEDDDSYINEFNDLVSRIREFVSDEDIEKFKSIVTEEKIEKELKEKNFLDKISIKFSIRIFEQKTNKLKKLLENNAERSEIIYEFREFIRLINEFLDNPKILSTPLDLIDRIIGLLMMLVGLLMIFLFPLGMPALVIISFIDGLIKDDIAYGLASALYAIYIYFPLSLAIFVVGYLTFLYGDPYIPP